MLAGTPLFYEKSALLDLKKIVNLLLFGN